MALPLRRVKTMMAAASATGQTTAANRAGNKTTAGAARVTTPTPAPTPAAAAAAGTTQQNGADEFSNMVTVIPDVRSNSVVVSGTKDDLRLLHELIDKVDIVLPQVRIEVVIAEVTLSDNDENGFSALGATVNNGRLVSVNGTLIGGTVAGPGGRSEEHTF